MANPVWETMTKFYYAGHTVRVWRECTQLDAGPDLEVLEISREGFRNIRELMDRIGELQGINAVEVVNDVGHGVIHYPDWK